MNAPGPSPVLVIIPARDEVRSVESVVRPILAREGFRVLVVDDVSGDGTARAARRAGAEVLSLPIHLGAWGAIQAGLRYALRHGYGEALTMDADGQHAPEDVDLLLQPLRSGEADVTIGSCPERGSACRRLAWRLFRGMTGLALQDLTSGFRAYNRRAIALLASPEATLLDYQDIGVLLLLLRANMRVVERQVSMCPREYGHSRVFDTWFAVSRYMLASTVLSVSRSMHGQAIKRMFLS
ncbi:MAG: glycosyltransferase family 2 protein [Thermodesulfobacteriota bacterium]